MIPGLTAWEETPYHDAAECSAEAVPQMTLEMAALETNAAGVAVPQLTLVMAAPEPAPDAAAARCTAEAVPRTAPRMAVPEAAPAQKEALPPLPT